MADDPRLAPRLAEIERKEPDQPLPPVVQTVRPIDSIDVRTLLEEIRDLLIEIRNQKEPAFVLKAS